ncbi:hypothetical protein [Paenibacillus bovis]|uniref:hypothetical protein n=1 Tax=Paenibacillus bovis TaxID=1616788 RepID=UPI0011AB51A4|nr:hypothetical protein [Paenibacillus bovis]
MSFIIWTISFRGDPEVQYYILPVQQMIIPAAPLNGAAFLSILYVTIVKNTAGIAERNKKRQCIL